MIVSTQTHFLADTYGLEASIEMLADAGFEGLDLSMFSLSTPIFGDDYKAYAEKIRAIADRRGVKFVQAHAPFGGGYEKYMADKVPLLPRAMEFSAMLGISNIVIHPIQKGIYYGNEKTLFDMNVEFYRSLAPHAKKYGIKIAIENMWQRHPVTKHICDDVLADPKELAAMYDALNDPEAFTVCLDLGHVALCQREPEDAIRTIGSRIGCLHIHDVDYIDDLHTLPGVGKIKWNKVCDALAEIGYKGCYNLEADNFFRGDILPEHHAMAAKYMYDSSRVFANRIEAALAAK